MPGMKGRAGHLPTCHTELHRWAVEHGLTSTAVGAAIGIHRVTVRRHFLGWGMSALVSRLYRTMWEGCPVPLRGRPQFFENPLPVRQLPLLPAHIPINEGGLKDSDSV